MIKPYLIKIFFDIALQYESQNFGLKPSFELKKSKNINLSNETTDRQVPYETKALPCSSKTKTSCFI